MTESKRVSFRNQSEAGSLLRKADVADIVRTSLEYFNHKPGTAIFMGLTADGKIIGIREMNTHTHWGFILDVTLSPEQVEESTIETTLSVGTWKNGVKAIFPSPNDRPYFEEYASLSDTEFNRRAGLDVLPPEAYQQIRFYRMTGGYEIPLDLTKKPTVGGKELFELEIPKN